MKSASRWFHYTDPMVLFARLLFENVIERGQGVWVHGIRSKAGPNTSINSVVNGSCPQFLSLQP
jgi:hypothetical protein